MSEIGARSRASELATLVLARDAQGAFAVDDRAALAVLSLIGLALARADANAELPRFLMEQIGTFTREAAVAQGTSPEAIAQDLAALERFLVAQMPASLQQQVQQFTREQLTQGANNANELASALGLEKKAGPLDSGARPAGTTAAGPMARFQLQVPPKKP